MKFMIEVCAVGAMLALAAGAQEQPPLRKGVSVQMAAADHAVEVREADGADAVVVAITADGKLFAGTERTEAAALSNLNAGTVYVKADARAPFQKVLSVLDALRGKAVVLLAAAPPGAVKGKIVAPYGIKLTVSR